MRLFGKLLKWLGLTLLTLLVAGAVYQQVGLALDADLQPPASDMVIVEAHSVHLICRGEGPVTFLLDAGAGAGTFEWWRLQPLLAKQGRACAFDRPGLGWSEPSGAAHDVATSADEISALVREARIPTPFIYVGHSLGADIALVYRNKYPRDVSALVLIEPGVPKDLLEDFHGTRADAVRQSNDCDATCYGAGVAAYLGATRLAVQIAGAGTKNLAGRPLREYRAVVGRPAHIMTTIASLNALPKSAFELLDVHTLGDTLVIVFASSDPRPREADETTAAFARWREEQLAYFAALAAMSTHGTGPLIIPGSTHTTMVMGETQSAALAEAIGTFNARR